MSHLSARALSAAVVVSLLGCASQPHASQSQTLRSNWTSPDVPCAKFGNLQRPLLRDIGVRIDAAQPWADGFRRALNFWNGVLAANLYEETDLTVCSVRIIDGDPEIFDHSAAARSQVSDWANFAGKIAVSPGAAREMSSAEIYATAVHEMGHMLGLRHNSNIHSVMYFLDIDGSEVLDAEDILALSRHHQLQPAIFTLGFVPIQANSSAMVSNPPDRSGALRFASTVGRGKPELSSEYRK